MLNSDSSAIFHAAAQAYAAGATLRNNRARYKAFTYGRQWDDLVTIFSGHRMSEADYARMQGKIPQTNNLIRHLVKSIVGRFRHDNAADHSPSIVPDKVRTVNCLDELDARTFEEYLISGCAIQRITSERRPIHPGIFPYVDNVSPERFFVNKFTDPRGWDIELVGMLHDMSLTEVLMRFTHGSPTARDAILKAYSDIGSHSPSTLGLPDSADTFVTAPLGRCRVIEAWTLESRDILRCLDRSSGRYFMLDAATAHLPPEAAVDARKETSLVWRYHFFAPDGTVLDSGLSPYGHCSHPFVVKFFPMTDGEVHSLVEDVIDQQRYVNRLITMLDHIMAHSAKGVLLFPTNCKPDNISWERIGSEWSKPYGIIPYCSTGGAQPSQVTSSGADAGAHRMIELELKLLDQISGVNNALRGEAASPSGGSTLYQSQVDNSRIGLLDIFESFNSFLLDRDRKLTQA